MMTGLSDYIRLPLVNLLTFGFIFIFIFGIQQKPVPGFRLESKTELVHYHEEETASIGEIVENFFTGHYEHTHAHNENVDEATHTHPHQHNIASNYSLSDFIFKHYEFAFNRPDPTWISFIAPLLSNPSPYELIRPPIYST